jgi:inorganic pyrophosphatase
MDRLSRFRNDVCPDAHVLASREAHPLMMLTDMAAKAGKRLNVIVETPRGSRNKFTFESDLGVFRLGKQLPAGAVFPYDFGFIPSTLAGDGDPLDALVLLDTPTFPGCLVRSRLVGAILGRQTGRSGRVVDNPRLIAVATKSSEFDGVKKLKDLPPALVDEIVHFFVSYNEAAGKVFEPTGRLGRRRAGSVLDSYLVGSRRRSDRSARHAKRGRTHIDAKVVPIHGQVKPRPA